jgi:hypothetical protein
MIRVTFAASCSSNDFDVLTKDYAAGGGGGFGMGGNPSTYKSHPMADAFSLQGITAEWKDNISALVHLAVDPALITLKGVSDGIRNLRGRYSRPSPLQSD